MTIRCSAPASCSCCSSHRGVAARIGCCSSTSQLESVIADGEPEQAKALLRILIADLRVNGRHDIQPTYRVITPDRAHTAGVCATSGKVETVGIEPTQGSRREED
jgi:hypothetical protein